MTLVTEKEAAEKWCPMARVEDPSASHPIATNRTTVGEYDSGGNLKSHTPGHTLCIGSRCMAWRTASHPLQLEGEKVKITIPDTRPPIGFCGAFGKVEP